MRHVSVNEEKPTKFWNLSASRSGSKIFVKDRVFFHNLAHISVKT